MTAPADENKDQKKKQIIMWVAGGVGVLLILVAIMYIYTSSSDTIQIPPNWQKGR